MNKFKLSLLTLAMAGVSSLVCSAVAQTAEQTPQPANQQISTDSTVADAALDSVEVIQVRGFASSLFRSLDAKRFGDTVSETISADDLGALPDVSMADALTRLPGISAVRTGGQAAEINIRGMSGGFVFSTLNGREQVSTSGKRNIEFDQYPSELINSAAVYKSPKASLIEGGVAGTVELQTASPLRNEKQHTFTVNARRMYNDRADEVPDGTSAGHRFSLSYQGKFLNDTLGFAAGYARLFQPSVATQFVGLAYNGEKDTNDDGINEYISEGFELQHKGGEETRDGYMAALEWTPHDAFTLKADAFLSKFDKEAFARGYRVKFGGPTAALGNPVLNGSSVIGGTFNRTTTSFTRVEIVNDDNRDYDEVRSYGINADWDVSDTVNLSFDVSHSSAKSNFRNGLLWALVAQDATAETPLLDTNVSITYQLNNLNLPGVGFNQAAAFSDVDKVMVSKYGIYPYVNEDEVNAVRFDANWLLDMPVVASLEAGVRYSERTYKNDRSVFEYGSDGAFLTTQPPLRLTADMTEVVDFKGDFAAYPSYLSVDLDKALAAWFPQGIPQPVQTWGAGNPDLVEEQLADSGPNTSWTLLESGEVYEDVLAGYVMANLDAELFGIALTGNIGVRVVQTDQSATNLADVNSDPLRGAQNITDDAGLVNTRYAPGVLGEKYTDVLPQLNLNFGLTDNTQIRFAAAKVMSRPPINRLASNTSITISDDGEISGNSSNSPFLRPFEAVQYDLSYEYYLPSGAIAFALFYKDIKSFVNDFTIQQFDFAAAGYDVPLEVIDEDGIPRATFNGAFSTAVNNGEGGYIRGAELAFTKVFDTLPEIWSGLGVQGSYSYTESEVSLVNNLGGASIETSFEGLSQDVFTGTVFWNYRGFDTRVSARYRSPFVSSQVGIDEQITNFDSETVVDMQASYDLNDHFKLLFQVNNLTDEPTKSYFGDKAQTGTIQFFGRQLYLGAVYTF
ncbi:TonB-dependent receptor [Rheinheimera sp. YQF-2]|uniref:TonB-dependent receptor n=1 Tax=Rheinheimera lutimaris TaxID=2740584 RepID=A0A7Y5ANR6_9GAMM|nr:TonB-dependent receptor [Rheinheimera lutimaris]NRQ41722.1 TonB-dependent receptor [Rheinheimera lutimaris]